MARSLVGRAAWPPNAGTGGVGCRRDRADTSRGSRPPDPGVQDRVPRSRRAGGVLRGSCAPGWGDRELDLPAASHHAVRRRAPCPAGRGVPRRASGAAGRRLQGALLRHRLPLPRRHRAHLLLRQPDHRRGARHRRRRGASSTRGRGPRRDTDEFFRDRQYGELWAGRRPSLHEISVVARPRGAPHRRPAGGAVRRRQDPGAARRRRARRRPGRGRRVRPTRSSRGSLSELRLVKDEWEVGELQEACDITTLGFERLRREWDQRAGVRRALDRGHLLPPRPRDGQRHRLRLDRRRRPARHDAALDRQHRPDHARASWCCSTWASRATTSTPPT